MLTVFPNTLKTKKAHPELTRWASDILYLIALIKST